MHDRGMNILTMYQLFSGKRGRNDLLRVLGKFCEQLKQAVIQ
jgi:hypothetical protein